MGIWARRDRRNGAGQEQPTVVLQRCPKDLAVDTTLVRIHSACLTGDVFGSQRCDCGPQLQSAIRAVAEADWGVLVYPLAHEGRGIGLVDKIRAYALQDEGLDTFEANRALGFGNDQRSYEGPIAILRALNVRRIRLLTRNPFKVQALARAGFEIAKVEPVDIPPTAHNADYLAAKSQWFQSSLDEFSLPAESVV